MRALSILIVLIVGARPAIADRFKVIVHPNNPASSIRRDVLRDVYLRKSSALRPIDLNSKARDRFTREVLRKTTQQLSRYWTQQIFSGKGVPPVLLNTTSAVVARVLSDPGAVGYIPIDADPGGSKVIVIQ